MIKFKGLIEGLRGWVVQCEVSRAGFRNLRLNNLLAGVSEIKKSHVLVAILLRALV